MLSLIGLLVGDFDGIIGARVGTSVGEATEFGVGALVRGRVGAIEGGSTGFNVGAFVGGSFVTTTGVGALVGNSVGAFV